LAAEDAFFDKSKLLKPEDRPVYGFIDNGISVSPSTFGNVKIVLKDDIKQRSTVTIGDSLQQFIGGGHTGGGLTHKNPIAPTPLMLCKLQVGNLMLIYC
jgi:hypothetical protein